MYVMFRFFVGNPLNPCCVMGATTDMVHNAGIEESAIDRSW